MKDIRHLGIKLFLLFDRVKKCIRGHDGARAPLHAWHNITIRHISPTPPNPPTTEPSNGLDLNSSITKMWIEIQPVFRQLYYIINLRR